MKTREIKELKMKPIAELHKLLKDNRERLHVLLLDLIAGKVKNVGELRSVKKDIARILTIVREKHGTQQ